MDQYIELINPWWYHKDWETKDKVIKKWMNMELRWIPKWIEYISLKPFSLNFIIGPRQVGKTTGLKLLIKKLLNNGFSSDEILYADVSLLPDIESFQNLLFSLKEYKYIFLDEVTSLESWWRPLRGSIDAGILENKIITVSGSVSIKLKKQAELFPGRGGKGKIIEVLPLSFPEFININEKGKLPTIKIMKLFKEYEKYGGFPGAVNEKDIFFQDLIKSIEGEILRAGLSVKTSLKIFSSLMEKIPSAMSYQAIARDIGISYKTVEQYLEYFENMFLLKTVYWKDKNVNFRKEKKIFFRDPFILRAVSLWTETEFNPSAIYENIIQEHFYRKFGEIYYFRNSYEIDCIAGDMKVEVKAGKPHRKYPKNVLVLDKKDIPMFLANL